MLFVRSHSVAFNHFIGFAKYVTFFPNESCCCIICARCPVLVDIGTLCVRFSFWIIYEINENSYPPFVWRETKLVMRMWERENEKREWTIKFAIAYTKQHPPRTRKEMNEKSYYVCAHETNTLCSGSHWKSYKFNIIPFQHSWHHFFFFFFFILWLVAMVLSLLS